MLLPLFVSEEFAVHRDLNAITFWIRNFFNIHGEVDGAHNPRAEFFLNEFLHCLPVDVDDFLKPILQWLLGDGRSGFPFIRKLCERLCEFFGEREEVCEFIGRFLLKCVLSEDTPTRQKPSRGRSLSP